VSHDSEDLQSTNHLCFFGLCRAFLPCLLRTLVRAPPRLLQRLQLPLPPLAPLKQPLVAPLLLLPLEYRLGQMSLPHNFPPAPLLVVEVWREASPLASLSILLIQWLRSLVPLRPCHRCVLC
jgi:hypothetical protein